MSFGTHGADAIPDRLVMDYAPTSRAACKACGSNIMQDTVRVGEKVRSPWHDGFDTKWYHTKCAIHLGKCVHDFKGFQRLRWADQLDIAEKITPGSAAVASANAEGKRVARLSQMVWEVKERLGKVKKDALKELIEENGIFVSEKAHPTAMLHGIADGLICGKLPPCPWCGGRSLELEGTLLRCYGYQNGATHCTYKSSTPPPPGCPELFGSAAAPSKTDASLLKREGEWTLTAVAERALKGWSLPPDAPVRACGGGQSSSGAATMGGASAGASGGSAGAKTAAAGKKRAAQGAAAASAASEAVSEDEAGANDDDAMIGMSFACIGTLRPSAGELQQIIEAHGGKFVSGSIGDGSVITHLIASEAESRKPAGKQAAKYAAALSSGVPIVSADFVLALANQREWFEDDEVVEVIKGGGSSGSSVNAAIDLDTDEDETSEDFGALKVAELRKRCMQMGLDAGGKKAELVERLTEAARAAPTSKKHKGALGKAKAASSPRRKPAQVGADAAPERKFGAALRQRKHMAAYLLDGELGAKLPSIASLVERRAARADKDAAKAPQPRRKLPPIQPKSALVSVDPEAEMGSASVYVDEYNLAYNTTLNLMDIRTGVNKFYKMQLLCSGKGGKRYTVFKSWGRVGGEEGGDGGMYRNVNSTLKHAHESNLEGAKKEFEQKFRELACVDFTACTPPMQAPGGYNVNLIPGQLGKDVSEAARQAAAAKVKESVAGAAAAATAPSTLPPSVQEFVELIFSERMMQQQLESLSIDLNKMPLGGISDVQTEQGYAVLRQIAEALKSPLPDAGAQSQRLLGLTNQFYNVIPHKFARKQTPPVITSREMLIEKIEAIDALLSVSAANSISAGMAEATAPTAHPTDANYAKLGCGLEPASPEEVEMVKEYAKATHAKTHNSYTLSIKHVFKARRASEASQYRAALGNRQLLWHGSRLTNWVGILSQGLRIAPPEAPVTGYMFGKGVYFADMVSKSANYCMATRELPTAVLLLCDVALGKQHELIGAQYEAAERSAEAGKHSTWGVGKTAPDPAGTKTIRADDGASVHVPMGVGVENAYLTDNLERIKAEGGGKRPELQYNEFIVYDTKQIMAKYVVVADVHFVAPDF